MAGRTDGWGTWCTDDSGVPSFDVAPRRRQGWHLVGSPGLAATVDAAGTTSVWATSRGMVRLVDRGGTWTIDGRAPRELATTFEPHGVTWRTPIGGGELQRRITADPDRPCLHLHLANLGDRAVTVSERWEVRPRPLVVGPLMGRPVPPPSSYGPGARARWRTAFAVAGAARALTERLRDLASHAVREPGPDLDARPRWLPLSVPPLRVRPTEGDGPVDDRGVVELTLAPGSRTSLVIELDDPAAPTPPPAPGAGAGGELLARVPDAVLAAEARWHVAQLRALRVPEATFGRTFVMQGSAYAFVHGLHGAPRDVAIAAVALAPFDPELAREQVRFLCRMCRTDGSMHYAHTGAGRTTSALVHASPTDLPLFLAWAVTEVVAHTGDRGLLDEVHPGAPGDPGPPLTVRERVRRGLRWMRVEVGTGPHGMLRMGSGDWADPISLMVQNPRAAHRHGESAFNAGFAAHVLPAAARLVEPLDPVEAAAARRLAARCRTAMEDAWTGRWFRRGWDGRGHPIGEDHLFLDAQVWALIAGIGTEEQRRRLVEEIRRRCEDPSPIGPTILDRPHAIRGDLLAPGWDCNGGVWSAIAGLAAWAEATVDPELAWASLRRSSMTAHAEAYPERWAGTWSGPDCRNSHLGDAPGGTFVHPATPMAEFPVANSNFHAGPLLGLAKVVELSRPPAS